MTYENPWLYNGKPFTDEDAEGWTAFVYLITNLEDKRAYVGKKLLWSSKTKRLKGKRPKRVKVPSDWKTYWSSSEELKSDVQSLGKNKFRREILKLCKSKGQVNYEELREQVERGVLLKPAEYYNSFVGGKIHRKHVIGKC